MVARLQRSHGEHNNDRENNHHHNNADNAKKDAHSENLRNCVGLICLPDLPESYILPAPMSTRRDSVLAGSRYSWMVLSKTPRSVRMKSMASRPAPCPPASGVT